MTDTQMHAAAVLSLIDNAEAAWDYDERGEVVWLVAPEGKVTPTRAQIEAEAARLEEVKTTEKEHRKTTREAQAAAIRNATTLPQLRVALVDYLGIGDDSRV